MLAEVSASKDDYQHAKLIVDRIEYDGDEIYNVMQETDDIHIDNIRSLFDESEKEHNIYICNTRRGSTADKRIYAIQLEDNIELPVGMTLTVGPQYWRKEIPKSKPIRIEYKRSIIAFGLMEVGGFKLSVYSQGKICFSKSLVGDSSNDETIQTISPPKCNDFIYGILKCVSGEDCYNGNWTDDTSRNTIIYFEDGSVLEYPGVYIHGETVSENIVDDFISSLGMSCKPWI